MDINKFLSDFADQFDETDPEEIQVETSFHDLEEWSSLLGLSVLNLCEKKYSVHLTFEELRTANTVQDLYYLIINKAK